MGMAKNSTTTSHKGSDEHEGGKQAPRRGSAGPISFFLALIIVALGLIQLAATFHSYAINLSELNGLKNQQAQLVSRKQDLENQIQRWNDKAYVTAQARDRLGFIFPGEQAIRVLHPEAVTGQDDQNAKTDKGIQAPRKNTLPWYQEMAYSFRKADQKPGTPASGLGVTTPGKSKSAEQDGRDANRDRQDTSTPPDQGEGSGDTGQGFTGQTGGQ